MANATIRPQRPIDADAASNIFHQYGEYRYRVGQTIGGRYVVKRRAAGGNGQIYFCYDHAEDSFYALKTPKLTPELLEDPTHMVLRLQREVNHWLALGDHDHIVRCYTLASIDNLPFIVLEWIADDDELSRLYEQQHAKEPHFLDWYARRGRAGLDLRRQQATRNRQSCGVSVAGWLKQHHTLPLDFALQIALDVCAGLSHAEYILEEFVHRDLNPRNVLLDEQLRAKVSDFGLALVQQELLDVEQALGSPAYMAPEQWRGEPLDRRTDIYALGCMLYEMVVGTPPFGVYAVDAEALRQRHEHAPAPHLPAHLPPALDAIIHRCLRKDPAERFGTWAEVTQVLTDVYQATQHTAPKPCAPHRPLSVEDLNRIAVTYYNSGALDDAQRMCEWAMQQNAAYANSYTNRGCIHFVRGDYKAALADFTQAIRLGRRAINGVARNNRGLVYLTQDQPDKALHDLEEAVESTPGYANARANLAVAYMLLERYEEALQAFGWAIVLDPTHVLARHNRGYLLHCLEAYDLALIDYQAALAHDPTFLPPRINRMLIYKAQGRTDAAEEEYRQIAWLSEKKGRWQQTERPGYQVGRPDPQFVNTQSLDEVITRPVLEQRRDRLRTLQAMGLAAPREDIFPLRAVVRVETATYAETLHERVLDRLDHGWRLTQLDLTVVIKEADGMEQQAGAVRRCGLWLDEEAMHELAGAGLLSLDDLPGQWLVLVNDYPSDPTHPLRLHSVLA